MVIKKISKSKIKKLYEHYINKDVYLSNFYDTSLQIPDDLTISQTPMKNQFNNSMFMKCKNVIRNLHYLDILKYTQSGFNNPNFLTTLDNFYNKLILDYNLVIPSTLEYIQNSHSKDEQSIKQLLVLMKGLNLPTTIAELGINVFEDQNLDKIADFACRDKSEIHFMPFEISKQDIVKVISNFEQQKLTI